MKRKWNHPAETESSRAHWRSLGELEGSKEFEGWLEREFPQGAQELELDETSRRSFVKLMGASTALAGFGVACKRPLQHLVPYNEHVEWVIPGKALYYSTAKPRLSGIGCDPLVVTTFEGRPTKVDGNRLHPAVTGGSSAITQASVLDMYDQDRSRGYFEGGKPSTAEAFNTAVLAPLRAAATGEKLGLVLSQSTSPTRHALIKEVQAAFPGVRFYGYGALDEVGSREAADLVHGKGAVPVVNFSTAKRVLSLDCDFLGDEVIGEDPLREFASTRNVEKNPDISRLYVAESAFTLTGGMADHRYRTPASQIFPISALIAAEVATLSGDVALGVLAKKALKKAVPSVYRLDWIKACAADLFASKGASVVVAGGRQSAAVHALVAAINNALGAFGGIISVRKHVLPGLADVAALASDLKSGAVETLVVMNEGDLAFDAPSDLELKKLLSKVPTLVQLGFSKNQTTKLADWHVPKTHYLETWGDCLSLSGVYSVQQPMINPMWGGVSDDAFLLSLLADDASQEALLGRVKKSFASAGGKKWNDALRDGFAAEVEMAPTVAAVNVAAAAPLVEGAEISDLPHEGGLEVSLVSGSATYDGRFANNGWLQEAPDPITKLTWDNAALVSVFTAKALGLENEDLIEIVSGDRKVIAPVLTAPGHADFAITIALGYYGNLAEGTVSKGVGYNAYPLMTSNQSYVVGGVTVRKAGGTNQLALTAEHYSMEGRAIAREGTVEMYKEHSDFAGHQGMDHHIPENMSLYEGADYENGGTQPENRFIKQLPGHEFRVDPLHQWAMTVDLNSCIGCNACVIACQSENNIPIVGKDQVLAGREMHWIRMDRYFTSPKDNEVISERGGPLDYLVGAESTKDTPGKRTVDDDQIEMISQPVACQQCESAPCETVCPVNATVHTSDGLNAMTYNRCIGTRYCANNCPYKARRFNYYDYNKRPIDKIELGPLAPAEGNATTTQQLQKNPNVTVRMRGVIEKCTYCVQRISAAKIAAKAAARDSDDVQVKANSFTVACQDACGAEAISFGNLKAKGDKINDAKKNPRNYDLLKYIGTRPRTSYLARIKNPNPKMPGADQIGTVTSKMH
ncbi:TAT-variant-translocated molybdopterin oxidoreductase [Verrucomicrobiales bacterium]|nr:TAT-variant-translocated molybdopterin oxidoreductase [Verrucomicrobiales bacterium]